MTVLSFTITFHSPFRVGAAYARDGVHAALDEGRELPGDHLKGVMRFAAGELFGQRSHWAVDEVFGSRAAPSPWSWSAAEPVTADKKWEPGRRHRVRIDPDTHSAHKDHLVLGEHAWAETARFTIARVGIPHPAARLADEDHARILRCAAAGVHGLGAWRRRGLGWVGITPDDGAVTAADITVILALARGTETAR